MSANVMTGDGGDNTLIGSNFLDDLINAGAGNDFIFGGKGNDTVKGGKGDDTVRGGLGDDIVQGGEGDDDARGGAGNDTVDGGVGNDTVRGSDGNDVVRGGAGSDTVTGDAGDDIVIGSYIFAGPNDDLTAPEVDTLIGGTGSDLFVLGTEDRAFYNQYGDADYALIVDFDASEGDTLQVSLSSGVAAFRGVGNDTHIFDKTRIGDDGDLIAIVKNADVCVLANSTTFVF